MGKLKLLCGMSSLHREEFETRAHDVTLSHIARCLGSKTTIPRDCSRTKWKNHNKQESAQFQF